LGLLAHALQHSGALDEALYSVEDGLALAIELGATHGADLYRLKGELLRRRAALTQSGQLSVPDEPEDCFRTAVTVARRHGARLIELRATTSLARLWAGQGKRAQAHQALAEIYCWFTEGFDTPDLREARTLLERLGESTSPPGA
jgi:adenylate cyclase